MNTGVFGMGVIAAVSLILCSCDRAGQVSQTSQGAGAAMLVSGTRAQIKQAKEYCWGKYAFPPDPYRNNLNYVKCLYERWMNILRTDHSYDADLVEEMLRKWMIDADLLDRREITEQEAADRLDRLFREFLVKKSALLQRMIEKSADDYARATASIRARNLQRDPTPGFGNIIPGLDDDTAAGVLYEKEEEEDRRHRNDR